MGVFDFLGLKKYFGKKRKDEIEALGFYELDDTLFALFAESENKGGSYFEVFEIANKLYLSSDRNKWGEDEKVYARGILDYLDYLVNGNDEKLNRAIEKLSSLVERNKSFPHAHYFLGKAYYHKSFTSSDPLKYQSLSTFHLTEAEKEIKKNKNYIEKK